MNVKDINGTWLSDGDSVTVIRDLTVKGFSLTLKRGKLIKKSDTHQIKRKLIAGLTVATWF